MDQLTLDLDAPTAGPVCDACGIHCGRPTRANEVHPPDRRCAWCRHGITWQACPAPSCGRSAYTAGPAQPEVVVCSKHGDQALPAPIQRLQALTATRAAPNEIGVA